MHFREIAAVVWHRKGHDIEVIYVGSDPEHLIGSEEVATVLAADAGLQAVPTPEGIRRWVRRC